jgi:hypothetical protein
MYVPCKARANATPSRRPQSAAGWRPPLAPGANPTSNDVAESAESVNVYVSRVNLRKQAMISVLLLVLLLGAPVTAADLVANATLRRPTIDGALTDSAWDTAVVFDGFSRPGVDDEVAKAVVARITYDDSHLYVGIICSEHHPERLHIRHHSDSPDVWQDDSVELFLRTARPGGSDRMMIDQFVVNAVGARMSHRRTAEGNRPIPLHWPVAAVIGDSTWTVEFAIPLMHLDLVGFHPGRLLEVKFGREDYTGDDVALSVWPSGSEYAGLDGYGSLYLGEPNLLADATPGKTLSAEVDLLPFTPYHLTAQIRADGGEIWLDAGGEQRRLPASGDWQAMSVSFATGRETLVSLTAGGSPISPAQVRHVRLVQISRIPALGAAIPVTNPLPLVITDVAIADARVVRGFVGTPFDGTTRSLGWDSRPWEYPKDGGGSGVGYAYHGNDGLHVTMADDDGFDAIQIRGGIRAELFTGKIGWQGSGTATPVQVFPGNAAVTRALFDERIITDRMSFYTVGDGLLADVAILRVGDAMPAAVPVASWRAGTQIESSGAIDARSEAGKRRTHAMEASGNGASVSLEAGSVLHLRSLEFSAETPVAAIAVQLTIPTVPANLRIVVQDPIDRQLELMSADIELLSTSAHIVLDVIDQVMEPGDRLSISIESEAPVTLGGPDGGGIAVALLGTDRDTAMRQALPYRLFLLKSQFACASEPRPWTQLRRDTDMEQWYATNRWGEQVRQLFDNVEHAWRLDPGNDTVRQYRDWLWRGKRQPAAQTPVPIADDDAPDWAVWAHTAWLESRAVAAWWLDERLVPTGEFGGLVGDDSDLYQNFVDLPYFESDGVGGRLLDAGARLAALAELQNLENGLNSNTTDPLHAYEEGVNQEALMAVWHYGDPVYLERCMVAAAATEELTTLTELGHRHFRSQQVGAAERDRTDTDTAGYAHPLMWHPAFEVLWYNRHPHVEQILRQWGDGWLAHMTPGAYATVVDVATEQVVSSTQLPLYGGYGALGSAFAFLAWNTNDSRYLAPFLEAYASGSQSTSPALLLPELLHRHGGQKILGSPATLVPEGIAATLLDGETWHLVQALKENVTELQQFPMMYTSAEPFTDRVFLKALSNVAISYTGGFATRNKYNRSHAVSWSGFGTDYAAVVLEASTSRFRAALYNFSDKPLAGQARFWSLRDGRYVRRLGPDTDGDHRVDADHSLRGNMASIVVVRGEPMAVSLAPRQVTVVELSLHQHHGDTRDRADLALSPLDTEITAGTVHGMAHNIGRREARAVVVLRDQTGAERGRQDLGLLLAPLDLVPVRVPYRFTGLPDDLRGWSVAVQADITVKEIFKGNNRVELDEARMVAARLAQVMASLP